MQVAVAADHAGFELKQCVLEWLKANVYAALGLGTDSEKPVDYPDFAEALGRYILDGRAERGVLICGSGVGGGKQASWHPRRPLSRYFSGAKRHVRRINKIKALERLR